MKHTSLYLALLALLIAGCSTPEPQPAREPPAPKVEPKVEANARAFLTAVIDDVAALGPKHPQLVNFKPEIIKNEPHMLMSRPNVLTPEGKPSSFPPLGFTYSHNAVMSEGKPPVFVADGCMILIKFYGTDPGLKTGYEEFYRGQGVQGRWLCIGNDVEALRAELKTIVEKHVASMVKKE